MEISLQPRWRMLSGIRAALAHTGESPRPEALKPFFAKTPVGNGCCVEEFSEELRRAGGEVSHVHSGTEVGNYITELLRAEMSSSVAVTNGQLIGELGLCEYLTAIGTQVLTKGSKDSAAEYRRALLDCAIGVTTAEYALADTGTLVLISGREQHRLVSLLPPVHVCLLTPQSIFPSLTQLLTHTRQDFYSRSTPPQVLTCITGPSRTADIEQTITLGVHGPQSLHVLIYS
jgi:L-lactate dehydrogenase complex protein LldG